MNGSQKVKFLKNKGLKSGDYVSFRVENQNNYIGPITGELEFCDNNIGKIDAFIKCWFKNKISYVTINEGYDAYINSIELFNDN
jgi:hypothetical protein